MKTPKQKLFIVALILSITFFVASSFVQQSGQRKYATMVVTEAFFGVPTPYEPNILIVYEDGKNEEIPLEKTKPSTVAAIKTKINQMVNAIASLGYELVSVDNQTYLFLKK